MILCSFILSLFSFLFIFSTYAPVYADDDWCIPDPAHPPCQGAFGSCTTNSDGSLGGFVAATASVVSAMVHGLRLYRPHIGLEASICDHARVGGNTRIYGTSRVYEYAQVFGMAQITGNAQVFGNARVYGNTLVSGDAWVYGNTTVFGDAQVSGDAQITGNAQVFGDAQITGNALVSGASYVFGNARVSGDTRVSGNTLLFGNGQINRGRIINGINISDRKKILVMNHQDGIVRPDGSADVGPEFSAKAQACLKRLRTPGNEEDCSICLEPMVPMDRRTDYSFTECGHLFCKACLDKSLTNASSRCPLCRTPLVKD